PITVSVDGSTVGTASDSARRSGQVGYATGQGVTVQFDNLSVYSGTPPSPSPSPSHSSASPSPSSASPSASASTSPSASPSPSVSPSPSTGGGTCSATYTVTSQWPGAFQGQVTVTNQSGATSSGWSTTFTFGN